MCSVGTEYLYKGTQDVLRTRCPVHCVYAMHYSRIFSHWTAVRRLTVTGSLLDEAPGDLVPSVLIYSYLFSWVLPAALAMDALPVGGRPWMGCGRLSWAISRFVILVLMDGYM